MLCLTRKPEDGSNIIRIGPDIVITIHRVKGKNVKVGIDAPRHYRILRGELPEKTLDDTNGGGVGS